MTTAFTSSHDKRLPENYPAHVERVLSHANGECPNCGAPLEGDGYHDVFHCENADPESYAYHEPDADPVYCVLPAAPVPLRPRLLLILAGVLTGLGFLYACACTDLFL